MKVDTDDIDESIDSVDEEKLEPDIVDKLEQLVLIPRRISASSPPITVENDDTEIRRGPKFKLENTDPNVVDKLEAAVERYILF